MGQPVVHFEIHGDDSVGITEFYSTVFEWTVNADKSGSGSGNCYTVDKNGDYRVTNWQGSKAAGKGQKANGTWVRLSGTGKYDGAHMSKGTWKSTSRFAEGFRIGNWTGECSS